MIFGLKTFLFTALIFFFTSFNAFSGNIYIEGQFTFPPPKTENPEPIEISLPDGKETITIAPFNPQVFGKTKAAKSDVMKVLAKTITQFDVIAIQEIRDKSGTAIRKMEAEVDALGTDYDHLIGPRLGRTSSKEQYAFIYNTESIVVGESYTFNDSPGDLFHREPFIANFAVKNRKYDFILITIHTDPDEATGEINALPIAVKDAQNHFPDEKDFIILGDLNADCKYFDENDQTSPLRNPEFMWLIINDMDTNLAKSSCTYDRIIITAFTTEEDYTGKSGVFRFDRIFDLKAKDAKKISDHYPVYSEFYVDKDTDWFLPVK